MPGIFDTVVDANVQALLRREQRLLVELRETLEREQADERRRVDELLATLEDLFTIVIVGEFNAGKSSLINTLFGEKLRTEGPIPVDDVISILRYGQEASTKRLSDYVVEQFYPVELLRNITLVDTPGTNSIVQRHQEITEDYIPRADLVLFDPLRVRDVADFTAPQRAAEGIDGVWVNGVLSYRDGQANGARAGRFLARSGDLRGGFTAL